MKGHLLKKWLTGLVIWVASIQVVSSSAVMIASGPYSVQNQFLQFQILVTGTITDETGAGLPGVNVLEKGTLNGSVTDINGGLKIPV